MTRLTRLLVVLCMVLAVGCHAHRQPRPRGIAAATLPDEFRFPAKTLARDLNYGHLTTEKPVAYILGPDDRLRIEVADLTAARSSASQSSVSAAPFIDAFEVQVSERGMVLLPLIGSVQVSGLTVDAARNRIATAYSGGYIDNPRVGVTVQQRRSATVMVMGAVARPEVYQLPQFENDIAHALARAGGLAGDAGYEVQVHRRVNAVQAQADQASAIQIVRIPLRAQNYRQLSSRDVTLHDGDVVLVPRRADERFYVVGSGRDASAISNGILLPADRDVDVVTAVAMATTETPPSTATIHRPVASDRCMLIGVDLNRARCCRAENILIQPGDIIYLNAEQKRLRLFK